MRSATKRRRNGKGAVPMIGAAMLIAVLAGCAAAQPTEVVEATTVAPMDRDGTGTDTAASGEAGLEGLADGTVVREDEWDSMTAVHVALSGTSATTTASGVESASGVVTITEAGVYRLSGSLDGRIVVQAPDDALVVLVLDGVDITASGGSAIEVATADDVAVHLEAGSENALRATLVADAEANAVLFSEQDLTISGSGALEVTATNGDGITSEDDLAIIGGTISVDADDDGIRGKDSLLVEAGEITVTAVDDGLKADNEEEADRGWISIQGGTVTVLGSTEGIEGAHLRISGGAIDITSSDDGLNATSDVTTPSLVISGGTTTIDAEGDGFDSNGTAAMSGGTLLIHGPTRDGNGAIDVDGGFDVTGGTIVAVGSSGMAQSPSEASTQGWIWAAVDGATGSSVQVVDASGSVVAELVTRKSFASVVAAADGIVAGESYRVLVDGTEAATVVAGEGGSTGFGGGGPGGFGGGGQPSRG